MKGMTIDKKPSYVRAAEPVKRASFSLNFSVRPYKEEQHSSEKSISKRLKPRLHSWLTGDVPSQPFRTFKTGTERQNKTLISSVSMFRALAEWHYFVCQMYLGLHMLTPQSCRSLGRPGGKHHCCSLLWEDQWPKVAPRIPGREELLSTHRSRSFRCGPYRICRKRPR